jgi:hypothetical protein
MEQTMSHGLERATPRNDADNPSPDAASDHGTGTAEIVTKWRMQFPFSAPNLESYEELVAALTEHLRQAVAAATLAANNDMFVQMKSEIDGIVAAARSEALAQVSEHYPEKYGFKCSCGWSHLITKSGVVNGQTAWKEHIRNLAPDPHFRRRRVDEQAKRIEELEGALEWALDNAPTPINGRCYFCGEPWGSFNLHLPECNFGKAHALLAAKGKGVEE